MTASGVRFYGVNEIRPVGATPTGMWLVMTSTSDSVANARFRFAWGAGEIARADAESVFVLHVDASATQLTEKYLSAVVTRVLTNGRGVYGNNLFVREASVISGGPEVACFDLVSGERRWSFELGAWYVDDELAIGSSRHDGPLKLIDSSTGATIAELPALREPQVTRDGHGDATLFALCDGITSCIVDRRGTVRFQGEPYVGGNQRLVLRGGRASYLCSETDERTSLVQLDAATGAELRRVELPSGWARDLYRHARGLVVTHEEGVFLVDDNSATPAFLSPVEIERAQRAGSDGRWFVGMSDQQMLIVVAPDGAVAHVEIGRGPNIALQNPIIVQHGVAAWSYPEMVVRVPLEDLVRNKSLTLDARLNHLALVSDKPTLAKDSELIALGSTETPRRRRPAAAAVKLADLLLRAGLLPVIDERVLLRTFKRATDVNASAAARLLQAVHGCDRGLARGFICHDWRFGQETDDVIAELQQMIAGDGVVMRQTNNERPGVIEVEVNGERSSIDVESLQDVIDFVNGQLARYGAIKRIHSLETNGDWFAYVACDRRREELLRDWLQ